MSLAIVMLIVGTLILIYAARLLVSGLIGLSAKLAVPSFILAMLVISIDLEEFAPAVVGSHQNLTALSYGSVLGTVIFLVCLALGSASAIYPLKSVDFPLRYILLLGGAIVINALFALDGAINRTEGIACLVLYFVYLAYLILDLGRTRVAKVEIEGAEEEVRKIIGKPAWHYVVTLGAGLIGLVVGALLAVRGTRIVLQFWGIAETILGATLLAIAANSVELVEAIVPARQGLPEVVIGNVVGSSIFQTLFTMGTASQIRSLTVEPIALSFVLPCVLASWVILAFVAHQRKTSRALGFGLVALYFAFVVVAAMQGLKI